MDSVNSQLIVILWAIVVFLLTVITVIAGYLWKQNANTVAQIVTTLSNISERVTLNAALFTRHEAWHERHDGK